jgi:hypothetical protein
MEVTPRATGYAAGFKKTPVYDEQIITPPQARVQRVKFKQLFMVSKEGRCPKKRAAVSGGFKVDNREASNRVDRSHSVSKQDNLIHMRESLIARKSRRFPPR